jgi:hypothetical protein
VADWKIYIFGGETGERDRLEDPSVDERVILKWIFTKWGVEWIDLAK